MGHPKKRPRAGVTYSTTKMDFARLSTGQWTICSDDWHMEAPSAPQVHTRRARDLLVLLLYELTMSESAAKNIRQNRFAAGRLEKGTLTLPVVVARPRDTTRQTHDRSSMHINLSAFCMPFWCCPLYFIFFSSSSSLPLAVGLATPSHTKWCCRSHFFRSPWHNATYLCPGSGIEDHVGLGCEFSKPVSSRLLDFDADLRVWQLITQLADAL